MVFFLEQPELRHVPVGKPNVRIFTKQEASAPGTSVTGKVTNSRMCVKPTVLFKPDTLLCFCLRRKVSSWPRRWLQRHDYVPATNEAAGCAAQAVTGLCEGR